MKNTITKILFSVFLFTAFSVMLPLSVKAISLSISPVGLYPDVLAGSHTEYNYTFRLGDFSEDMNVVVTTDLPGFDSWVTFKPGKQFIYKAGQDEQVVTIMVDVPNGSTAKLYQGYIRLNAKKVVPGNEAASVISGTRLDVDLTVTNNNIRDLVATAVRIADKVDESSPINVAVNINNRGNIPDTFDKAVLVISDISGKTLATYEQTKLDLVDAFTAKEIVVPFAHQLKAGDYFATIQLYSQDKMVFTDRMSLTVEKNLSVLPISGEYLNENMPYYLLLIAGCSLLVLILVFVYQRKKPSKRSKVIAVVLVLPVLGLLTYLGTAIGQYRNVSTMVLNSKTPVTNYGNTIETADAKLLGVATTNASALGSLIKTANGAFNIFAQPDLSSKIVYQAYENETLHAVEDITDWYKVELPGGGFGYLPKASVVKSVSQN
jgi:hypothetical protein